MLHTYNLFPFRMDIYIHQIPSIKAWAYASGKNWDSIKVEGLKPSKVIRAHFTSIKVRYPDQKTLLVRWKERIENKKSRDGSSGVSMWIVTSSSSQCFLLTFLMVIIMMKAFLNVGYTQKQHLCPWNITCNQHSRMLCWWNATYRSKKLIICYLWKIGGSTSTIYVLKSHARSTTDDERCSPCICFRLSCAMFVTWDLSYTLHTSLHW